MEEAGPNYGRYNYMNFPPEDDVWRAEDITAIAKAVHQAGVARPSRLIKNVNQLPDQLSRKTVSDVSNVLDHLHNALLDDTVSYAPKLTIPHFLAVLASEITFMKTHAHERNLAMFKLVQSRNMLTSAKKKNESLIFNLNRLTVQIDKERLRKTRANDRKAEFEKSKEETKTKLQLECERADTLRQALEKAKMNDVEVRRRLDRIRLKVGALRGEMVVPTVDEYVVKEARRQAGPDGTAEGTYEVHSSFAKFANNRPSAKFASSPDQTPSSSVSSLFSDSLDEPDMDRDEEAMEYRLLKNRLAMVEAEASEWKATLRAERTRFQLVQRSKTQLEDELGKMKQSGGSKAAYASGGRLAAKTDQRGHAKIRTAVRAAISMKTLDSSPRKRIRKGRKSRKAMRALAPDV